jgi:hypothetical protein
MKKIVEYRILWDSSSAGLNKAVNEHIRTAWQPFGSLAVSNPTGLIYQTLVKYEEEMDLVLDTAFDISKKENRRSTPRSVEHIWPFPTSDSMKALDEAKP